MPLALILSSFVAGSRVGGLSQSLAFAAAGVDPVLVPTVVFGRHPGWGPPGGAAVEDVVFASALEGVEAQGLFGLADVVLTGYFASPGQVEAAARAIDAVRAVTRAGAFSPRPLIMVDPILGDVHTGLYVREAVAAAVAQRLAPRADVLCPNLWELGRLSGVSPGSAQACVEAARGLCARTLVTSAPAEAGQTAVIVVEPDTACRLSHPHVQPSLHGGGDLFAALTASALVQGRTLVDAAERAAASVADVMAAAALWKAPELPIVAMGARLCQPQTVVRREPL